MEMEGDSDLDWCLRLVSCGNDLAFSYLESGCPSPCLLVCTRFGVFVHDSCGGGDAIGVCILWFLVVSPTQN